MARRSEIVEATLGFGLGIPAMIFGYWLLTEGCHLIGPEPPTYSCVTGSNFLSLFGFSLVPMGLVTVVASIVVLKRRTHRELPPKNQ